MIIKFPLPIHHPHHHIKDLMIIAITTNLLQVIF